MNFELPPFRYRRRKTSIAFVAEEVLENSAVVGCTDVNKRKKKHFTYGFCKNQLYLSSLERFHRGWLEGCEPVSATLEASPRSFSLSNTGALTAPCFSSIVYWA
jgi:hypothetical protein